MLKYKFLCKCCCKWCIFLDFMYVFVYVMYFMYVVIFMYVFKDVFLRQCYVFQNNTLYKIISICNYDTVGYTAHNNTTISKLHLH